MKKLITLLGILAASCSPLPAQNTLAGNLTVQQSVKFTGDITPPQLTADVNDYAPASFAAATIVRVSADAPRVITGLAGGADGRIVWLSNIGGAAITLANAFAGSTAANRFDLGGANYELAAGNGLGLWYDATASRWRPLSGLAAGGGGGASGTVTSVAVSTANGVSATVANPTTTPTLTFSLGAITPSSVAATSSITGANLSGTNTGDQSDATLTFSDVTTNNVSTARHGFAPKLPNDAAKYLDGTGTWSTPAGGSGGSGTVTSVSVVTANGVSGSVANASTTPAITLSLGAITPSSVAAVGAVTGSNLSGTNTGDQTSVTGNAGTATALATARTINGVSFDGTAAITVPAAAGTLTGSTLASGVTASSLTSAAGGTFGTAAFTAATAYDPAGAAAAITLAGLGGVPTSRTVNGHALTGNVSVTASDVGLGSVENTALSTWTGSSSLATVGTITSGTWQGAALADAYIASAATWNAKVSFPGFGTTGTTAAVGNDSRLSDARTPLAHNQAVSTISDATTVGQNVVKLTNPSAVTFPRFNVDNTVSALAAADFLTAIGGQTLDSDLTALAANVTNGLWAHTAAGTGSARTITGTANQVTVTNGDGVSGNPTLSLPQNIATTSTPQFAGLQIVGAGAAAKVAGSGVTIPSMFDSAFGFQTAAPATVANYYQADTFGSYSGFVFHRSNGTSASPTAVASGDLIGFFAGGGYDGTARVSNQAAIFWYASENWTGSARGERIDFYSTPTGSTSSMLAIRISGAALRFAGYGAGTLVTDSSGNVTASSDRRLKNVSGKFTRGLDAIMEIQPKVFTWKPESGMNTDDVNVGFIAQDVQDAIPEAVGSMKTVDTKEDDGTGKKVKATKREASEFLTLSDRPIIAALVNAVKELKAENDALLVRVSALENGKAAK